MDPKPSYLSAFLRHPVNRVALLSAAVVAIFASIPLGWSGLALVGVVALGSEILAALTVPGLPSFKAAVEREQQRSERAQRRLELLSEVSNLGDSGALATYQHMSARVQSLYQSVAGKRTTLTLADVEKLEDMTLDYLGLCAVNLSLRQRKNSGQEELAAKRVASLQAQLQQQALPEDEQRQLRSALAEYTEVLQRARRLAARRTALEATLIALPDKMEEVYQLVATAPYSSDMGSQLEASLSRLRIAEEVASEFDAEPFDLRPPPPLRSSQAARPMPQPVKH